MTSALDLIVKLWCLLRLVGFAKSLSLNRSLEYQRTYQFIDDLMNPKNCSGIQYAVVSIGETAGFAAQFQLAAGLL